MTKAAFDKYLSTSIPRALLLYGECEFFYTYYTNIILQRLGLKARIMDFEYSHAEALSYLGVSDLFGNKNVLLLRLYKGVRAKGKSKEVSKDGILAKEYDELIAALSSNPNSFLIVQLYKSPTSSEAEYAKQFKGLSALFKPTSALKDIVELRCFNPNDNEKVGILAKRANELHLKIDSNLLFYLLERQNGDLGMAYNELDKFIYYTNITNKLIDELSYGLGVLKIESLLDCLFDKKGNLVAILETLNDEGLDNMQLLREIHRYFYILFKLYAHSKSYGNMDASAILGYRPPPQIYNVWCKRSLKIKTQDFLALFDILNAWRIKQMQGKDVSLQSLIALQRVL